MPVTKLVSLHGSVNGSARITASESRTVVEMALRGRRGGSLTAHIIASDGIYALSLDEGTGSVPVGLDVRGILVADVEQSGFICEGSCGCSTQELNRAKEFVRMQRLASRRTLEKVRATGAINSADISGEKGGAAGRSSGSAALSPITQQILSKAQSLFVSAGEDTAGNTKKANGQGSVRRQGRSIRSMGEHGAAAGKAAVEDTRRGATQQSQEREWDNFGAAFDIPECKNCASTDDEAVKNPFPQSFPNSSWQRKKSDAHKLMGVAMVRGIKYDIIAVESTGKYPPRGMHGNLRRMRAENGRRYWVKIVPRQKPV